MLLSGSEYYLSTKYGIQDIQGMKIGASGLEMAQNGNFCPPLESQTVSGIALYGSECKMSMKMQFRGFRFFLWPIVQFWSFSLHFSAQ